MAETDPGLRERKRRATRRRIEAVALDLFEDRGFDATTMEEIAAGAGVSRATVFRYFGSKDEIVYAPEGELREVLRSYMRRRPSLSLGEVMIAYCEYVDAHPDEQLRRRMNVIVGDRQLSDRFVVARAEWEQTLGAELAARRGREVPTYEERVRAAAVMAVQFTAFADWGAQRRTRLATLIRRAVASLPELYAS